MWHRQHVFAFAFGPGATTPRIRFPALSEALSLKLMWPCSRFGRAGRRRLLPRLPRRPRSLRQLHQVAAVSKSSTPALRLQRRKAQCRQAALRNATASPTNFYAQDNHHAAVATFPGSGNGAPVFNCRQVDILSHRPTSVATTPLVATSSHVADARRPPRCGMRTVRLWFVGCCRLPRRTLSYATPIRPRSLPANPRAWPTILKPASPPQRRSRSEELRR